MPERTTEFDPTQRPRQLRRRAIVLAKLQGEHRDGKWVPAPAFMRLEDDLGERIRDEEECLGVLEHLQELKLIEEWVPPGIGGKTQAFAQRRFRITNRGYALWSLELEPIQSIADERLGD